MTREVPIHGGRAALYVEEAGEGPAVVLVS